jgi:pilus assembly protein FimV
MKLKLGIACASLLAIMSLPALALQLGEIQVKSALNQPLVAAIPLQPNNLTELQGLSVGLASAEDFKRAGLQLTPTDQILRFRVITDNNGEKLILVTSSEPITDPYLDFLVQVDTRQGRQVHEFVALLNPVIAAPAPPVQEAPVVSNAPSTAVSVAQPPAELPPASSFPQPPATPPPPQPQPQPQPAMPPPVAQSPPAPSPRAAAPVPPAPPASAASGRAVKVHRGDTLYGIARHASQGTDASVDQMMLAMQIANPDAFFKHNINNLKAGAILRIPTREQIDQHSVAAATAEVRRQYETWRAAKPHAATVVEGAAARAAAQAAPKTGSATAASDHLTLVPPSGKAGGTSNHPGVAGGTGTATVSDLRQQLRADRDTLISLNQSNADLESRMHNLQDISTKAGKLLSFKDATIAELQRKLASAQPGAASADRGKTTVAGKPATAGMASKVKASARPVTAAGTAWYMQPLTWIVAGLVAVVLVVLAAFARRRTAHGSSGGPLPDPDDIPSQAPEPLAEHAGPDADDVDGDEAATHALDLDVPEPVAEDPYGLDALRQPSAQAAEATEAAPEPPPAVPEPEPLPLPPPDPVAAEAFTTGEPEPVYSEDPVDTKLDLARAYLDMGDPVGARAMLEEVLEEGTQLQKDEATRLLGDIAD